MHREILTLSCVFLFLLAEEGLCQRRQWNSSSTTPKRKGGLQVGSDNRRNSSSGGSGGVLKSEGGNVTVIEKQKLNVGLLVPYSMFHLRDYNRAVSNVISHLQRKESERKFYQRYNITTEGIKMYMTSVSPSPRDILNTLCHDFLQKNVSAILYFTNSELFGRSTAASQYFLQLAGYLGLPVIAWNADNSGLLRRASQSEMVVQLAPSVNHQASAMLSILMRYNWHNFAIITSAIAGHDDFVQAIRDRALELEKETSFKFIVLTTVMVLGETEKDLGSLVGSESRILLLYCSKEEARNILQTANKLGLTGSNYVWVVTQSVIGDSLDAPNEFPVGMLGVHFNTSHDSLKSEISTSIRVFISGVEAFTEAHPQVNLTPNLSCEGLQEAKWAVGDIFYQHLKNVSIDVDSPRSPIQFGEDGDLKNAELQIMNLRHGFNERLLKWGTIGAWRSWQGWKSQLEIKDIVWPGFSHRTPSGVPDRFHIKIGFLEQIPYIQMIAPDLITGKCSSGVLCRIASEKSILGLNHSEIIGNASYYQCCSGFCIDLLQKFEEDIGFTYDLSRVRDGHWGTLTNGKWNGLIAKLTNKKVDMVISSLMINSEREAVIDFSVPFMDSGLAILTKKRTEIISPYAFLEPFDTNLWITVGLSGIAYSFAIFIFELLILNPCGLYPKVLSPVGERFSLFRSFWTVWARLFQASVQIGPINGVPARFMIHIWSMFGVIFLATYKANLAVFMITREESKKFVGLHDPRLSNPTSEKPPMKFGTVLFTHSDSLLRKHLPEMAQHMMPYNVLSVMEGVKDVRDGTLDAFIYEGPVLQSAVNQDTSCILELVGSWYAHTGYGLAFTRNSKFTELFNKFIMEYKENGDLERLKRFYFTGPCFVEGGHQGAGEHAWMLQGTAPLEVRQFYSAFLILVIGIIICGILFLTEKCFRQKKSDKVKTLINPPIAQPMCSTIMSSEQELNDQLILCNSHNPICSNNFMSLKQQININLNKIYKLEERLRTLTAGGESNASTRLDKQKVKLKRKGKPQTVEESKNKDKIPSQLILRDILTTEIETVL